MEPWTVLIADPSEEFREALALALTPSFRVRCCARGDEALELLTAEKPDLLILDLSVAGLEGISLLRMLKDRPPVLIVTDLLTDCIYALLTELGVEYAIRKPSPIRNVADRAYDLMRMAHLPSMDLCLVQGLTRLGLACGRHGFQHLLTGLPLLVQNRSQQLSKELYNSIAERDHSSAKAVEKAIREVIREGWENGDRREWERCFPGATRCPANREFLFRISDLLRERKLCG